MTTNDDEQTNQTGTWEIDWDKIYHASDPDDNYVMGGSIAVAAVREYRRQQAEQGMVEVRREAIRECYHLLRGTDGGGIPALRQELAEAIERNLAVATEQDR